MQRYLLASHGHLAAGMKEALSLIGGSEHNVDVICAYCDDNTDLKQQIADVFAGYDPNDEVLVISDVFGGSVNNELLTLLPSERVKLIAGMNLALVLELVISGDTSDEAISSAVKSASEAIVYCNPLMAADDEDEDF